MAATNMTMTAVPAPYGGGTTDTANLFCNEVLDASEQSKTPDRPMPFPSSSYEAAAAEQSEQEPMSIRFSADELPETVEAVTDFGQLNDTRVLQNLLQNEDKFVPPVADYMSAVQKGQITPDNRKLVADWMLGIVHERCSQPEVFCLAMNLLDRFLCLCQIRKSQLQLLGAVCILIGSKIREPCPIPGKKLIIYTDYSITAQEIKDWELLVLYKLHWELSSITSLDYLDQAIPRLGLNEEYVDLLDLRRRTETILVLAATDYQFAYHPSSLLAASAIITAISSLSSSAASKPPTTGELHSSASQDTFHSLMLAKPNRKDVMREIKLRLQTATHTATDHIDKCTEALKAVLPEYLKGISEQLQIIPEDMEGEVEEEEEDRPQPDSTCGGLTDSLICKEEIVDEDLLAYSPTVGDGCSSSSGGASVSSRSSSPLSAVEIFTEYNSNVLQAIFDQVESNGVGQPKSPAAAGGGATKPEQKPDPFTILVGS